MNRSRALILSLAVAVAAVAGLFAVGHTITLGAQARSTSTAEIARRTARLDRYEASLRKALANQPPPLPSVPDTASQSSPSGAPPARVVYHRPPPIVVVTHRAGGEHEFEGAGADD